MFERLSPSATRAMEFALREALSDGSNTITTAHLLRGVRRVTDELAKEQRDGQEIIDVAVAAFVAELRIMLKEHRAV